MRTTAFANWIYQSHKSFSECPFEAFHVYYRECASVSFDVQKRDANGEASHSDGNGQRRPSENGASIRGNGNSRAGTCYLDAID